MEARLSAVLLLVGTLFAATSSAAHELTLPRGLQEQAAYIPEDNPLTPEKIALGKQFFWDTRWSRSGTVSDHSAPSHESAAPGP